MEDVMRKRLLTLVAVASFLLALSVTVVAAADVFGDIGPKADVAALKATRLHKPTPATEVDGVHVAGDFGYVAWGGGDASGYTVYKRVAGETWKTIDSGGGVELITAMVHAGVPRATAIKLCSGWPKDDTPCQDENGHPVR
jgi:hypothetical protein